MRVSKGAKRGSPSPQAWAQSRPRCGRCSARATAVVIDRILYGNTFAFFTKGLTRFGVNVRLADFTDPDALAQALAAEDRLKLVYFETPANPNLRIIDIARVSSLAKSAGALTIVDNTFATPDSAKSAQARR